MIFPDAHIYEGCDSHFAYLSYQCTSLLEAWGATYRELGKEPENDARIAYDASCFRRRHPDAAQGLELAAGQFAGRYMSSIGQHLVAVADLLATGRVTVSLWPLVRAELEVAGRIAWLLEPDNDEGPVMPDARVARALMEELFSWCQWRYTASRGKRRIDETRAKSGRDRCRKNLETSFPDCAIHWNRPGDEKDWFVAGEAFEPLGNAAGRFLAVLGDDTRGVYDLLSSFSHPSILSLARQTKGIEVEGVTHLVYAAAPEVIEWQAMLACQTFFKAAQFLTGYYQISTEALDEWAMQAPESWFKGEAPNSGAD